MKKLSNRFLILRQRIKIKKNRKKYFLGSFIDTLGVVKCIYVFLFFAKTSGGLNNFFWRCKMAHYYHKIVSPWLRTDSKSKTVDLGAFSDKYVEMLKDIQWIGSEKIDGTNLNFYYDGNHVHVYGHTDKSDFNGEVGEWIAKLITPEFESIFEQIFGEKEAFVNGELIGPKIQSNLYNLDDYKFVMFDIYCKSTDTYWSQDAVTGIAEKLGFDRAKIVMTGTLDQIKSMVESTPVSFLNPKMEMEGIVIRPVQELKKANGERIIYKVKVRDLLGRNASRIK